MFIFTLLLTIGIVFSAINIEYYDMASRIPEEESQIISELMAIDKNVAINYCQEALPNEKEFCEKYVTVFKSKPYNTIKTTEIDFGDFNLDGNGNTSESKEKKKKIEEKIKQILKKYYDGLSLFQKWAKRKLDILVKKIVNKIKKN